jgi:primosomal protein N' (replication factor Y) (superfamily II helicase)
MTFAEIVVNAPVPGRRATGASSSSLRDSIWETTYHYSIPPQLSAQVAVGQLVVVPFGAVERQGIIVGFSNTSPVVETKAIQAISDPRPVLFLPQLELARWISRQYLAPLPRAVQLMLPPGLLRRLQMHLEPGETAPVRDLKSDEQALLNQLQQQGRLSALTVKRRLGSAAGEAVIRRWVRAGYAVRRQLLAGARAKPKIEQLVRLVAGEETIAREKLRLGRGPRQADVLRALLESDDPLPSPAGVMRAVGCGAGPLRELEARGFIQLTPARDWIRLPQKLHGAGDLSPESSELRVPSHWDAVRALLLEQPAGLESRELCHRVGIESKALRGLEHYGLVERAPQEATVALTAAPDAVAAEIVRLRGAERHLAVLKFLQDEGEPVWLGWVYAQTGATLRTLRDLEEHGLIEVEGEEVLRNPLAGKEFAPFAAPRLTPDQEQVWDTIRQALLAPGGSGRTFLLHGVTGSGKTEIYLRALEQVLAHNRGAIVLVPEIGLTPQTIQRFAGRFPNQIAIQHSDLSLGERFDQWRQVRARTLPVVVGTRSALFAPVPNLGLIIIDEEHDESYKNGRIPYYHARDAAVELARLSGATLILGSATPDVVTYERAQRGAYTLLQLPGRILWSCDDLQDRLRATRPLGAGPAKLERLLQLSARASASETTAAYSELPPVAIVDMREELKAGNRSIFSKQLTAAVHEALAAREQVILFLNRRGTATFVMCRDCGAVVKCPHCDVSLTYHGSGARLQCHHCDRHFPVPNRCPQCGSERIRFFGLGTEKVADLAAESFPEARILRWDRDVTAEKGAHELILERFTRREADILVGTQMVAKGLDLPLVTVVGVISADTALNLPDYRAGERTFQLLTQVAGRAGRSVLGGRVIIQTYAPEHYAIQAAGRHDYAVFYCQEMAFRRRQGYPPFKRLVRLVFSAADEAQCRRQAERLHQDLKGRIERLGLPGIELIGPAPCFMSRINGRYRWHLLVRARDPLALLRDSPAPPGWQVEVDPLDVL